MRKRILFAKRRKDSWLLSRQSSKGKTAFDWRAYVNRCDSLKLLRASKTHVDTRISTEDGYSDTVHWQVLSALCPRLIESSQVSLVDQTEIEIYNRSSRFTWQHLRLPAEIDALLARQLIECAYGEKVSLDRKNLCKFYLVSVKYNIKDAIKICLNYAKTLLDVKNCIQLFLLSLKHKHNALKRASYSMIRSNFKLILQVNSDFHLLQSNYLRRLLLDDFLKLNEDEEFAWLAIVRWTRGQILNQQEILSIYNEMVTIPASLNQLASWGQVAATTETVANGSQTARNIGQPSEYQVRGYNLNFYSPSVPFEGVFDHGKFSSPAESSKKNKPIPVFPLIGGNEQTHATNKTKEDELFELIKCLRFIRFRSLNAFDVILANESVQKSEKLTLLVSYMKLRYIVRKKLPMDKDQLRAILPRGGLDMVKTTQPKRMFKSVLRFVKSRQSRTRQLLFGNQNLVGDVIDRQQQQQQDEHSHSQQQQQQGQQDEDEVIKREQREPEKVISDNGGVLLDKQLDGDCLQRADKPRVPSTVAILIGGWQDGTVSKSLLAYDFVYDKWFKLNVRLPEPRAFHASCSSAKTGQIFIFGGTNGEQILDSVLRFDPALDVSLTSSKSQKRSQLSYKFHNMCPMRERRCHLSGVFHSDGKLYALGGHNGQQRLTSGEWFDPKSNQWHPIADMTIARSDASACSHDNKIFIAGGQITDQFIQSSVEFYKASDDTWTFAAPMIVPRMSFRLVSFRSHLFAMGGTNGLMVGDEIGSVTRSVERYNANLSSWSLCAPMGQKRSSFGVMCIEDKLIVVGGFGGRRRLKSCESLRIGRFQSSGQRGGRLSSAALRAHELARPGAAAAAAIKSALMASNNNNNNDNNNSGQEQVSTTSNEVVTVPVIGANAEETPRTARLQADGNPRNLFAHHQQFRGVSPLRSAMKWAERARLPSKRSGFSISVVSHLKNAKDYTYYGSLKTNNRAGKISIVKQKSRWHRFKIIKRRKLIRHLKIAVVITIVILIM